MKNFDKINDYLKGKLSAEAEASFKKEIALDETLEKEVRVQQLEEEAIAFWAEEQLMTQIDEVKNEIEKETNESPRRQQIGNWKRYLLLAASVALVVIAFWFVYSPQPSNEFAILEHKKQFSMENSTDRTPASVLDDFSTYQKKMNSGEKSEITKAIIFFKSIPNSDSSYVNAQYNLAHAYFLNENYKAAIKKFQNYFDIAEDGNRKKDFAQYNLLLSYLANKDEEGAKLIYNDLLKDNSRYKNNLNLKNFFNK